MGKNTLFVWLKNADEPKEGMGVTVGKIELDQLFKDLGFKEKPKLPDGEKIVKAFLKVSMPQCNFVVFEVEGKDGKTRLVSYFFEDPEPAIWVRAEKGKSSEITVVP